MRARSTSYSIIAALVGLGLIAELIALAGHVLLGWGDSHYLSTPVPLVYRPPVPLTGEQELSMLAAAAARQPAAGPTRARPVGYVMTETWGLGRRGSRRLGRRGLAPDVIQVWRRPDGSGRMVLSEPATGSGAARRSSRIVAGPAPVTSSSASVLSRVLRLGEADGGDSAAPFQALLGLAGERPIPPATEAEILRLLATVPEIANRGTVIDRAGRPGVAVSVDASETGTLIRTTLIFDPSTGRLLECDRTLLGEPGGLDVQENSTIGYEVVESSGYVANTMDRP